MKKRNRSLSFSFHQFLCLLAVAVLLSACGGKAPPKTAKGAYKVGQPYEIGGSWYYPKEDYSYDETGIASWYGADFHGLTTSNGEVFNKNELTAAHKTLPLPTLARVTNLDNGRSIVVRINDRGPFSSGRIIDMSQRSAQLLGFEQQGTAKVRVQVLADESKAIADAMRRYGGASPTRVASAGEPPPVIISAPNAPVAPVTSEELAPPETTVKNLAPVRTTPDVHQQLVDTTPVQEVVQLPVTGPRHIYVQAGAFTVLENATKLKQKLANLGSVATAEAIVNGKKFYRVRVGPLANVASADNVLEKVRRAGVSNARTIVD
ncbi:MAG: septal ring lytic transglycosylase RlpA family protein [Alphaproteobacteria bacterium]|nr:septal ring lytic transglycosylase RlpA family protein [Alphaproteobacteria bacterium]